MYVCVHCSNKDVCAYACIVQIRVGICVGYSNTLIRYVYVIRSFKKEEGGKYVQLENYS